MKICAQNFSSAVLSSKPIFHFLIYSKCSKSSASEVVSLHSICFKSLWRIRPFVIRCSDRIRVFRAISSPFAIATPSPALRIISKSFSLSPTAIISFLAIPSSFSQFQKRRSLACMTIYNFNISNATGHKGKLLILCRNPLRFLLIHCFPVLI